jgi:hypothetical protein
VKQKYWKQNEAKQKIFGSETKCKYTVVILLWSKKKFEAKKFFYRLSVQNTCKTDLIFLRFALKPAHPTLEPKKVNIHTNNTNKETMDLFGMDIYLFSLLLLFLCPVCKINKKKCNV